MTQSRQYLVAFAVLVAVFVALYPYLMGMGLCDQGGECPYMVQSSHTTAASPLSTCLSAALAASPAAVLALATFHRRRVNSPESRPEDIFLSLDPPPPRLS